VCLTRKRIVYLVIGLALFLIAEGIGSVTASRDTGMLTVTFLDVGPGDAAVVEFPDRRVMLIDGGGFMDERFDVGKSIIAPFLYSRGITRVDYIVLTHPHHDHAGGLAYIADHFKARELWHNGEPAGLESWQRLTTVAERNNLSLLTCSRQTLPRMIGSVRIDFLNPNTAALPAAQEDQSATNNNSLVLKISCGSVSFLMAADILEEREHALVAQRLPLAATILKVPHHGSKSSSSEGFIGAVKPEVAVVSGRTRGNNSALHPSVAERYYRHGATIYETAANGAVRIATDGTTYTALPFHPEQKN
jgi:competence protein ComEC